MFGDNKDFYPTPKELACKMLEGVDFNFVDSMLEPSAGKGDLLDVVVNMYKKSTYSDRLDIDCVEIQPELKYVLEGKGYRVVHDDFLTYHTFKKYSLIVSNPPFSQGAKHLTKMLDMQQDGGGVICLLNAETLKNPYTMERKALVQRLDDLQANVQYLEQAFNRAERKTSVEVAIVRVFIPKKKMESFIFEKVLQKAMDLECKEEVAGNTDVMDNDFVKAIVKQSEIEIEAGIRLIDEYKALSPHILSSYSDDSSYPVLSLKINGHDAAEDVLGYNRFVKAVRAKYWKALLNNPKFTGMLTHNLLSDYLSKVQDLKNYDFSEYNIYAVRKKMGKQIVKGVEDTIIALFDELSHQHSWYPETSRNIHYYNGWMTNKVWIINKKVIIPLDGFRTLWKSGKRYEPERYEVLSKLADIEKCFNYLDSGLTGNVDLYAALCTARQTGQTKKIKLKYFNVTFYKKGTCHIEFNNEELLKKFNIFGSQRKGWLPQSYGKKSYAEMTPEDKYIVDSFEGKAEYHKVMANAKYYICETEDLLSLPVFQN